MEKRCPKYDKHGNERPFQDRPFVDELNGKDYKDEALLSLWRMEKRQMDQDNTLIKIKKMLFFFYVIGIIAVVSSVLEIISFFL